MTGLASIDLSGFCFRVADALGPNEWLVLTTDRPVLQVAAEIAEYVCDVGNVGGRLAAVTTAHDTVALARAHLTETLVLAPSFSDDEWRSADANRSQLERAGTTVLLLDDPSFGRMEEVAPNLASWIGGCAWRLGDPLRPTPVERAARLSALRVKWGWSDDEVVAMARNGTLPADPTFAEWLALIGHGELLDR